MAEWLVFLGVCLMGAMVPGPNTAIIMRNTLNAGRRDGFVTILGSVSALLIHALLSIVGIAALISQSPMLFSIVKWCGAAYLLFIGFRFMLTKKQQAADQESKSDQRPYLSGLMVSLLNPKILLFFIALVSQMVTPADPLSVKVLYGMTPVMAEVIWASLLVILLSADRARRTMDHCSHWIERTAGAALVAMGIKIGLS